jgi:RNA polymerase sigma factor (sigma-70 family)
MALLLRLLPGESEEHFMKKDRRVLVVDDESAIVDGVTMLLGCEAIENSGAHDRLEALSILTQRFYPVVITDLCLHTIEEGLQLVDDVRRLSPESRIVVLSAFVRTDTEEDLLRRGVSAVMHKPAESDALIAAVLELFDQIVEDAAAQETPDLEHLYLTARKKLYAIPRSRYGLTPDQCEDVLQEAWLLFLQKQGMIRCAGAWLAGAVVNISRQQIDRRVRKRETSGEEELFELIAEGRDNFDDVLAVRQALEQVDDRARTLCQLIAVEGLSYEEVSAATGMPVGSIGPLFIRAKKKLRAVLAH